jgi:hypothetical protein
MKEEDAIDHLNQMLEMLGSHMSTEKVKDEIELQAIPSKINDIIRHSSGYTKSFIRSSQMNHDILHIIILFYFNFKDKHSNDIQTVNRAKRWVGDSIMDLIGNTNHDLHIPSLDALLTSIGEYNTLEFNEMKSNLLLGMIRGFSSQDEGNDAFHEMLKLRQSLLEEPIHTQVDDMNQPLLSQVMENFLENDQSLLDLIH